MYKREAEKLLRELARSFPVVAVTGPRQSGKTTLTQAVFKGKKYVSLEDLDQRTFARKDPHGFLNQDKKGLLIDEVQNVPELFSYIQGYVDSSQKAGHFIITGSQQFGLMSGISQSLAGRTGFMELLPFSLLEIEKSSLNLNQVLYKGLYPPLYSRKVKPQLWYEDYIKTYIEKDLRQIINIKDLSLFQKFLSLCASRSGQLLNVSELGNTAGIDTRTVQSWISALHAAYIIFLLRPHHKNFSKKLVKTPKLYFYDTGLLSCLLRLKESELPTSPHRGPLFESLVISECLKHEKNRRLGLDFYFWRDNKGVEVDLLFERQDKIVSMELKSGQTPHVFDFNNLRKYQKYADSSSGSSSHKRSFLIYGGDRPQKTSWGQILPWKKTRQVFKV